MDELLELIKSAEEYGTPDFATKVSLLSLKNLEKDILEELRAAQMLESGSDAEIAISGDPLEGNAIQASFLGKFLSCFQELLNSMAQTFVGSSTARASLPRNIIAENRLMLLPGFLPGSFAVRFKLPTKEELGQLFDPTSHDVLQFTCKLLNQQIPTQDMIEFISHSRVKKHYEELMELIAKRGAEVTFRDRSNPYGFHINSKAARDRIDWLDLLQTKEEIITVTGELSGGSIDTDRFEIKTDEQKFIGKISGQAKLQMKNYKFGEMVKAELKETTSFHEETALGPHIEYYLLKFSILESSPVREEVDDVLI